MPQTIRNTREDLHDRLMDVLFGLDQMEVLNALDDIMVNGERVDIDVEQIADCDSREDFLEHNQLGRIIDNIEKNEYDLW